MTRAVFLDRDGVINELCYHDEKGIYSPTCLQEFKILPKVKEALKILKSLGYLIIIVSNQPGIAFKYISEENLKAITSVMRKELLEIDAVYYCPHHPNFTGDCVCRKPKDGLLLQALKEHDLDLKHSVMIGDNLSDIKAGRNCGKTILIARAEIDLMNLMEDNQIYPDFIAPNLFSAANLLLSINKKDYAIPADCYSCRRPSDADASALRKNS